MLHSIVAFLTHKAYLCSTEIKNAKPWKKNHFPIKQEKQYKQTAEFLQNEIHLNKKH